MFDRLGAFAFSPEEDTPAAEMPDQIPEEVKQERLDRLMRLQQGISLENNRRRVGEECEALIERTENGLYVARSMREAPEGDGSLLLAASAPQRSGTFVRARITGAETYDLRGEVI